MESSKDKSDWFVSLKTAVIARFASREYRSLLVASSLVLIWLLGFGIRLFSVLRFESIIHEYDPWFNYRSTRYMVEHGFYSFVDWFDERAWYPLGRIVGGTVFPGLMYTSGILHRLCHLIGIPLHIREICVFLAPVFSGLTALATYALTNELFDSSSGLLAALFVSIAPGYLSRSVAGSYDNEGIAIFAMMLTFFLWIKSLKTGKIVVSVLTALSYAYMVSAWGGYVFIINLIPLHVFVLILMGRFNPKLYRAYSVFFVLGTLLSMQIPFVGFQPVRTSEHMAALGTFGLVQVYQLLLWIKGKRQSLQKLFVVLLGAAAAFVFTLVILLTYSGVIAPWSGRFYSLWDTGYAKIHIPIITSVSEHQPTTWTSFYFDLHVLICLFPAGVWFAVREFNDERVFIILYALFASYFAGVMVRLMLTLTPVVCVLAAYALSRLLQGYLKKKSQSDEDTTFKYFVIGLLVALIGPFFLHCTWISSNAYSSPSIILALKQNDHSGVSRNAMFENIFCEKFWLLLRQMKGWQHGFLHANARTG